MMGREGERGKEEGKKEVKMMGQEKGEGKRRGRKNCERKERGGRVKEG